MAKKLEWYVEKYGEEEGKKRHEQFRKNVGLSSRGKNSLVGFVKRYGEEEGKKRFDVFVNKSKKTEKSFIIKYGKEEGKERYKKYVETKTRKFKNTYKFWLDRGFTKEEAKRLVSRHQEKTSLSSFIKRYGESEGPTRYIENNKKQSFAISLAGFISRYGEELGEQKFCQYSKDRAVTLDNQIKNL